MPNPNIGDTIPISQLKSMSPQVGATIPVTSLSDVISNYNLKQAQNPMPAPVAPPTPDLGDKIASSIQQKGSNIDDILAEPQQGSEVGDALSKGTRIAAQGAEAVASPAIETAKAVWGMLPDALTKNFLTPTAVGGVTPKADTPANPVEKAIFDWSQAHPKAYGDIKNILQTLGATGEVAGTVAAGDGIPGEGESPSLLDTAKDIPAKTGDAADAIRSKVVGLKNQVVPVLTPEEQVGKIIQGKTSDIPAAQRTFGALPSDTPPVAKMSPKELSDTIQKNVVQKNLDAVDTKFANDTTVHPMSDFIQTTGKGASKVETNYVQQAIDQLKAQYTAINDSQGLSDIKALEEKANTKGITSQDLNNLAKEHGRELSAFNENTGEAASGLKKQAAENTRTGVKTTARTILGQTDPEAAAEAARLDKETSDALNTKRLLDKQVEKEAVGTQKTGKPNKIMQKINKFSKEKPITSKLIKIGGGAIAGKKIGGTGGEAIGAVLGGGL